MTADADLAVARVSFRNVLGTFPTGVVIVTGVDGGAPVGLAVGSFTSVSLDPPLVGFLPDKGSRSWPRIERSGSFAVNVLGESQLELCRRFASKDEDKFAGVHWRPGPTGSAIIGGAIAWIDCEIADVLETGDHYFVLGRVVDLEVASVEYPLVFFKSGYARLERAAGIDRTGRDRTSELAELTAEVWELAIEEQARRLAVLDEDGG